jgi:hypothetical protein
VYEVLRVNDNADSRLPPPPVESIVERKPPAPPPPPPTPEPLLVPPPAPPAITKKSALNVNDEVTELDAEDAADVPLALVAVTVYV